MSITPLLVRVQCFVWPAGSYLRGGSAQFHLLDPVYATRSIPTTSFLSSCAGVEREGACSRDGGLCVITGYGNALNVCHLVRRMKGDAVSDTFFTEIFFRLDQFHISIYLT